MIKIKHKKYILPFLILLFNIMLIIFPSNAVKAAKQGLKLWYNAALPSLFPFAAGTSLLIYLNLINTLSRFLAPVSEKLFGISPQGFFAFLSGITSGYPIGASTIAGLYEANRISKDEALHLILFCNNSGPLFILGTVGSVMLKNQKSGLILLMSHYLAPVTIALALKPFAPKFRASCNEKTNSSLSFGKALSPAIEKTSLSMINVGGFIVFFSVITELVSLTGILKSVSSPLSHLGIDPLLSESFILALVEMTKGCALISQWSEPLRLPFLSLLISFGGLCVAAQSISFLSSVGLPVGNYIKGKLISAVLSFAYCIIIAAAVKTFINS
ncbi:MAG: hypothetical protein LUG66_00205 [Clostridiales bacterium]|nr:hypothetical protein [Clostridiales bacterium]